MTTRNVDTIAKRATQNAFIVAISSFVGTAAKIVADKTSLIGMKDSFNNAKTFFEKMLKTCDTPASMKESTEEILGELLCRTRNMKEKEMLQVATKLSGIINLMQNKGESIYISLPVAYVDERTKNANNALWASALTNIATHAVKDTFDVTSKEFEVNRKELQERLLETVVAGVTTTTSLYAGQKAYERLQGSVNKESQKALSVVFRQLVEETDKSAVQEAQKIITEFATTVGNPMQDTDVACLIDCVSTVSSIIGSPSDPVEEKKAREYLKKETKLKKSKKGLFQHIANFTRRNLNEAVKKVNKTMKKKNIG